MISPEERAVIDAARAYVNAPPEPAHEDPEAPGWSAMMEGLYYGLECAVRALEPLREHALTWGQVPAGWEVLAPDGRWYRVDSTRRVAATGMQMVTMLGKEWARLPRDPVTARGSSPAIEALGFPEVLEDGP